jgi:hypothetical protein
VSRELRYLRRNWGALGGAFGTLVAGPLLLVGSLVFFVIGSAVGGVLLALGGYFFLVLGAFRLVVGWVLDERRVPVAGELAVRGGDLFWDGRRMARRQALTAGFVAEGEMGQVRVRLCRTLRRKPLGFVVRDEEQGRALLRALGLDAAQTTAGLGLASLARVHPLAVWANVASVLSLVLAIPLCLVWGMSASAWTGVAAILGLLVLAWAGLYLAPARAQVGVDGVLLTWLWRTRFIRYEDLAAVRSSHQTDPPTFTLALHGGEEIRLPLAGYRTLEIGEEELSLRVRRIEQAAEESRRIQADRAVALPPRGDRPAHAWLAALRAAGSGADADHRRAPVAPDTLLRIAEDAGSPPERRVAAAAALGPGLDAQGRARLRVASSTTASPEVRDALALAAADAASDEALAEALDRVQKLRP